ncbi:MAG: hypothetical protein A2941_02870 [Candidatus Yanofskybacteria bacterium RIFCSPLOWO2_01_FULL_49_17]|uniref:HD domain-containing protein n=1 Tax=Candidatus Yanofskybacteria bacterium RIFCSPLOWO2_01_FULL_49_17 TaxID=1802700 RepID=A0A1F8GR85_9BACT|nr:MAG: hypothetical protein A2941_02870 [Candidatus Yanofskybacteria bacterium RIFCSPLOWO2_01_FULL_49_17]
MLGGKVEIEQALIDTPEFQQLKEVIENTLWHNNERVYDHALFVLKNLKQIIEEVPETVQVKLKEKTGERSRQELLSIATILHDISKTECIVTNENGTTSCPDHEETGAGKAVEILKRFGLSEAELDYISEIIRSHALTDAIFTPDNKISEEAHKELKNRFLNSIYIELMLLTFADAMSEYTVVSNPEEYALKMDFYRREVKSL